MLSNIDWFAWVLLPLLIFFARVVDVSIATIRILFLSKGIKGWTTLMAFFEILIWLLAMTQIMQNLSNPACYIAYASGFAMGTLIGMIIEEKLAFGKVLVQVISPLDVSPLIKRFEVDNIGVTKVRAEGVKGGVQILYSVVDRSALNSIKKCILGFDPKAFYLVHEIKYSNKGIFSPKNPMRRIERLRRLRKSK
ncbi:MAG: DUF5698 domain-containing protein [Caldisericia bacterium]|nr:DUF5698 domain-containing protein [Caldisericia bacterium]